MHQLVNKARQGDKTAEKAMFEYLFVRFSLIAKKRIGIEDAEDMAQDACMTVLQKYKSQDVPCDFEAWAYQILRNKIGNYLQHHNVRKQTLKMFDNVEPLSGETSPAINPMTRRQIQDCFRKLIKSIPLYARVLNLTHQGYTTPEICQLLNIKANYLYVILNRSRKLLNECLTNSEVSYES